MTAREKAKEMTDNAIDCFFDDIENNCVEKSTMYLGMVLTFILGLGLGLAVVVC